MRKIIGQTEGEPFFQVKDGTFALYLNFIRAHGIPHGASTALVDTRELQCRSPKACIGESSALRDHRNRTQ